jgi:hypothetical protein
MWSTIVLLGTLSALSSAHSDPRDVHVSLPEFVGGNKFMASLKGRNIFSDAVSSIVKEPVHVEAGGRLETRYTPTCGSDVGNCDAGYCCSAAG